MRSSLFFLTVLLSVSIHVIVGDPALDPEPPNCTDFNYSPPKNTSVCSAWQTYDCSADLKAIGGTQCTNSQLDSCCDAGTAKRAINWALEDDGCGVVGGLCLQKLVDLACHVNCAPKLVT